MSFGGGGSGAITNHVHDNTPLQGGPLQLAGTTIGSLNQGSITYSDGAALQELVAPGVPAGEVLTFPAAATAPSWQAGGATPAWQLVESFSLGAASNTFNASIALTNQFDATDYDFRISIAGKKITAIGSIDIRVESTGTVGTVSNWYWSNKLSGGVQSGAQDGNKTYFYLTQADQVPTTLFGSILDFTRNPDNGNLFGQYTITIPTQDMYQGGLYCEGDFTTIEAVEMFTDGGQFEAGTVINIWKCEK
jgi:hypothetical protein